MYSHLDDAMRDATLLALEQMAFLLGGAPDDRSAPAAAQAVVAFEGPLHGSLALVLHGDLLPSLAANMLGTDDVPAESLQQDALGELANVICGNVLPRIGGPAATFRLARPRVTNVVGNPHPGEVARAHVRVDDGSLDVRLYVDSPPEVV